MKTLNLLKVKLWILILTAFHSANSQSLDQTLSDMFIQSSGVYGGSIIHLGSDDGKLTAELARSGRFAVHGIATTSNGLKSSRSYIESQGLYGQAAIELLSLHPLPYANDIANILIVDDLEKLESLGLKLQEVLRVTAPEGVIFVGKRSDSPGSPLSEATLTTKLSQVGITAYTIIRSNGLWAKVIKPRPSTMDDWTHFEYSPSGNQVSKDTALKPATYVRWLAGPTSSMGLRSDSSVSIVMSDGKMVSITSEDVLNIGKHPNDMRLYLIGRDAHNGVLLWHRPFEGMMLVESDQYFLKYNTPQDLNYSKPKIAMSVGIRQPFPLVAINGSVFTAEKNFVVSINIFNGSNRWKSPALDSIPETILAQSGKLYVVTENKIYCLSEIDGSIQWTHAAKALDLRISQDRAFFLNVGALPYQLTAINLSNAAFLWKVSAQPYYSQIPAGEDLSEHELNMAQLFKLEMQDKIKQVGLQEYFPAGPDGILILGAWETFHVLSAKDGSFLWSNPDIDPAGKGYLKKAFFLDNLVWGANGKPIGRDPFTGVQKTSRKGTMYHRCQDSVATTNYFISGRNLKFMGTRGTTEYLESYSIRGACRTGIIPAYGKIFEAPQSCTCFPSAVRGFLSLGEKNSLSGAAPMLEKGPGYGAQRSTALVSSSDWPTLRHDFQRSGHTSGSIPSSLKSTWSLQLVSALNSTVKLDWDANHSLGDPLSSPVAAEGKVFVTAPHLHQVFAINQATGTVLWKFTAGGRVDSPPTIYEGMCYFGSQDGWVYALKADTGELVWRFCGWPIERIPAYGQFESRWPVHGSILVVDGMLYFTAGRSTSVDGGLLIFALNATTGAVVWQQKLMDDVVAPTLETLARGDILVSDGTYLYLSADFPKRWDLKTGAASFVTLPNKDYVLGRPHTFYSSNWRRLPGDMRVRKGNRALQYGGASGILLSYGQGRISGFEARANSWRLPYYYDSILFGKSIGTDGLASTANSWVVTLKRPINLEGLISASDILCTASTPDMYSSSPTGELSFYSLDAGNKLSTIPLNSSLIYEPMAVAQGKLFVCTRDGKITAYADATQPSDANSDGLPDGWQLTYFSSISDSKAAPGADPDGDGLSNLDEFQTQTVPTDSRSRLAIISQAAQSGDMLIQWQGVTGVNYTLESTSDFTTWTTLTSVPGVSPVTSWTDSNAINAYQRRFYRVKVP